ncbi:MAG: hypothetical protein RL525_697 [Bacteroidota bacterium]|jgi:hypothetical protein
MEANKTPLLEVLNNLASIHHEVRNDQTQLLDIETLGKLKLLAAQLYMEVDIELLSMEFPELQETDSELTSDTSSDTIVESTSDLLIDLFVPEVEIANIELPFAEIATEVDVIDETLASPEAVMAEIEIFEEIAAVQETVVLEVVEEVQIALPDPIPVPVIEPNDRGSSAQTLAGIIGQFPLSRRFEFSNILFGGDMDNMGLFVQEIIDAPNAAARGDVYDRWYEQKQWRRRDESASDMWRMIKRIFTQ